MREDIYSGSMGIKVDDFIQGPENETEMYMWKNEIYVEDRCSGLVYITAGLVRGTRGSP